MDDCRNASPDALEFTKVHLFTSVKKRDSAEHSPIKKEDSLTKWPNSEIAAAPGTRRRGVGNSEGLQRLLLFYFFFFNKVPFMQFFFHFLSYCRCQEFANSCFTKHEATSDHQDVSSDFGHQNINYICTYLFIFYLVS